MNQADQQPSALTVVMPVYNEVESIAAAIEDVRRNVFSIVPSAGLLLVDDGSRDGTAQRLDSIAAADPQHIQIIHQKNGGHGAALMAGLDVATGEYVLLVDSDAQIPLSGFEPAWQWIPSFDAVLGMRSQREDPFTRCALSRAIRWFVNGFFGVSLRDANCPFKIVRRSIWTILRPQLPLATLAPSLFLAIFIQRRHYTSKEIVVAHRPRLYGRSKIRHARLLWFCFRAFGQLLHFRLTVA
jgi:glycosyltransferase involved in cell wall biosynthesis